jgi:hypothetical protein
LGIAEPQLFSSMRRKVAAIKGPVTDLNLRDWMKFAARRDQLPQIATLILYVS